MEKVEFSMERDERLAERERREEEREMLSAVAERDTLISVSVDAPSTWNSEADAPSNEEAIEREREERVNVLYSRINMDDVNCVVSDVIDNVVLLPDWHECIVIGRSESFDFPPRFSNVSVNVQSPRCRTISVPRVCALNNGESYAAENVLHGFVSSPHSATGNSTEGSM